MNYIIKIINIFKGLHWYFALSVVGVIVIYIVNYIGVEFFNLKPQLAYFASTIINLALSFLGNSKIFNCNTNKRNFYKFIFITFIFLFLINGLFYIFTIYFNINYLIAITINFFIFPLLKFLSYKYFVFY